MREGRTLARLEAVKLIPGGYVALEPRGPRTDGRAPQPFGRTMKLCGDDVQSLITPGYGHFVAEEAPEEMLAALNAFLAPYRSGEGAGAAHDAGPQLSTTAR
jgi:hypothetical protein